MSSGESPKAEVAALRRDYMQHGLDESDLDADPFKQFEAWFHAALNCPAIREPNAMVLATVSADGQPHARYVLLKGYGPEDFVFFTNYDSAKGHELASQPRAALTFGWLELERQVRIEGTVTKTSRAAVEAYFPAEVPAPDGWGGYSLAPEQIEFWQGRTNRLHDRLRYRRQKGEWTIERLAP
jgi:pyridoxamine 5'-phosphate oxidase